MTFQERWAEGPEDEARVDLLTPEEVRFFNIDNLSLRSGDNELLTRLCHDYLTLWDRNKNLANELRRVHNLSQNELIAWWSTGAAS